jgi:hypothetical protein
MCTCIVEHKSSKIIVSCYLNITMRITYQFLTNFVVTFVVLIVYFSPQLSSILSPVRLAAQISFLLTGFCSIK